MQYKFECDDCGGTIKRMPDWIIRMWPIHEREFAYYCEGCKRAYAMDDVSHLDTLPASPDELLQWLIDNGADSSELIEGGQDERNGE